MSAPRSAPRCGPPRTGTRSLPPLPLPPLPLSEAIIASIGGAPFDVRRALQIRTEG